MSFVYVARQPIYTATLGLHAYELLYRAGDHDAATVVDGDRATATVLVNALTEIGLGALVGDRPAYVNMTRALLDPEVRLPLPPDRVVFEILEDVAVDADVVRAVETLVAEGYQVALDDFVYSPEYDALLRLAHVVKLDVQALGPDGVEEQVALVRPFDVELLAEKVETAEEFAHCRALGFRYYQGWFFSRPDLVRRQKLPANRLAMLRLLAQLQDPDADLAALAATIGQDVALSYKILRFLNSVFVDLAKPVESLHQGVLLMGTTTVRRWATLLVMARIDDKPNELMVTAMVRGRFCEHLARGSGASGADGAFTAGLFSVLDALLDLPMEAVLAEVPLGAEIEGALLHGSGQLGALLACVFSYETGEWAGEPFGTMAPAEIRDAYVEAVRWATDTLAGLPPDQ